MRESDGVVMLGHPRSSPSAGGERLRGAQSSRIGVRDFLKAVPSSLINPGRFLNYQRLDLSPRDSLGVTPHPAPFLKGRGKKEGETMKSSYGSTSKEGINLVMGLSPGSSPPLGTQKMLWKEYIKG